MIASPGAVSGSGYGTGHDDRVRTGHCGSLRLARYSRHDATLGRLVGKVGQDVPPVDSGGGQLGDGLHH